MTRPRSLVLFLMTLTVYSCSQASKRPPLYTVKGRVFFEGSPAVGAVVIFHAIGEEKTNASRPRGKTDVNGDFDLTTYKAGDGAPNGEYVVTVEWKKIEDHPEQGTDLLPAEYADPKTSRLRAAIVAGSNDAIVLRLTRTP